MTSAIPANQNALTPAKDRPSNIGQQVVAMIPQDIETMYRVATIYFKGGICPPDCKSEEQAFARIMTGAELGVGPLASVQNISSINNRTSVWGDLMLALVENSGLMEDFEEKFEGVEGSDDYTSVCRAKRKGRPTEIVNRFSIADAKAAGLWGKQGPWQTSKKRMLKMRARSFTLRDGFPDVLKGVYSREELIGDPMIDVTPSSAPVASAAQLNAIYLDQAADPFADSACSDTQEEAVVAEQQASERETPGADVAAPDISPAATVSEPTVSSEPEGGPEIEMNRQTPYAAMTAAELRRCCHQAVDVLNEYERLDYEGLRKFWADVNMSALCSALTGKGMAEERKRLEGFFPLAA